MPLPRKVTKYYELTRTEKVIAVFCWMEKPTLGDLNHVAVVAQVEHGINKFRAGAGDMTKKQLEQEAHDSTRLAEQMTLSGDPRPHKLSDAHAMIPGAHPAGARARAVISRHKVRIDDYINGCWLPRNTDAKKHMPSWLIGAVPHSRIHRENCYIWIDTIINLNTVPFDSENPKKSRKKLESKLRDIEFYLQTNTFPSYVMKPKGQK